MLENLPETLEALKKLLEFLAGNAIGRKIFIFILIIVVFVLGYIIVKAIIDFKRSWKILNVIAKNSTALQRNSDLLDKIDNLL